MRNRSLRCHFLLLYLLVALMAGIVVPALGTWFSMKAFRAYQLQRRNDDFCGFDRVIDTYIKNLAEPGHENGWIKTIYGFGYRLDDEK